MHCFIIDIPLCVGLVLVGVKGNATLGTTVNVLLGWICTIAIVEGTIGLLAKCLIFGKLFNFATYQWFIYNHKAASNFYICNKRSIELKLNCQDTAVVSNKI